MPTNTAALFPTVIVIGGVITNSLLIAATLRSRPLREDIAFTPLLSLFISDAACSLFLNAPSALILWLQPSGIHPFLEHYHAVLTGFFGSSAFWHLALISLLKCVVITRPLDHHRFLGARLRGGLLASLWALNALTGIANDLVGRPQFDFFLGLTSLTNRPYFIGLLSFGFFLPSGIVLLSNLRVFLAVREARRAVDPAPRDQWRLTVQSVRSAKNVFIMCLVFWVTYAPSLVMFVLKEPPPMGYVFFAIWLYQCFPLHNPVLYIALHRRVQAEIRRLLPKRLLKVAAENTTQTDAG